MVFICYVRFFSQECNATKSRVDWDVLYIFDGCKLFFLAKYTIQTAYLMKLFWTHQL